MSKKPHTARIPVGVSSCLLGENVRFDGGHKKHNLVTSVLTGYFDYMPICPEVAIGLGIPREPIRLVSDGEETRVRGVKNTELDVTRDLQRYGKKVSGKIDHLCGYIFKARSPSCGMERVKTYSTKGLPLKSDGVGAFAAEIMRYHPNLPIEEERRLNDPGLRDNFLERVFTYYEWKQLLAGRLTAARLIEFHASHKLTLMAHNQAAYRRLGQMVAEAGKASIRQLAGEYEIELMAAMKRIATRKQHTNVLQHLQGYFSKQLSPEDRNEMTRLIDEYRQGLVPRIAPLTLLRHHFRHYPNDWVSTQSYLDPYPQEIYIEPSV